MQSTYTDKAADDVRTVAQAARELGVHADTIRRWANAGKVAYFRTPNGHRRFLQSDIAAIKESPALAETMQVAS